MTLLAFLNRSEFFDHLHLLYEHGNTNLNLSMALTLARIQQDVLEFAEFYVSKVSWRPLVHVTSRWQTHCLLKKCLAHMCELVHVLLLG